MNNSLLFEVSRQFQLSTSFVCRAACGSLDSDSSWAMGPSIPNHRRHRCTSEALFLACVSPCDPKTYTRVSPCDRRRQTGTPLCLCGVWGGWSGFVSCQDLVHPRRQLDVWLSGHRLLCPAGLAPGQGGTVGLQVGLMSWMYGEPISYNML